MNGGTFEFAGGFTCDKMSGFGTLKFSEPSSITSMSTASFLTFSGFHSTPLTISNFVFAPSNVFTFTLTEYVIWVAFMCLFIFVRTHLILGNGTINYYGTVQVNDNSIFQVLPNSEFQINAQPSISVTLDDSSILINNGSVKVGK